MTSTEKLQSAFAGIILLATAGNSWMLYTNQQDAELIRAERQTLMNQSVVTSESVQSLMKGDIIVMKKLETLEADQVALAEMLADQAKFLAHKL